MDIYKVSKDRACELLADCLNRIEEDPDQREDAFLEFIEAAVDSRFIASAGIEKWLEYLEEVIREFIDKSKSEACLN